MLLIMKLINSLSNINTILEEFIKNDEMTSIAYIPVFNIITAKDIITIKKAQKLLDIVIVQNIAEQNFQKNSLINLEKANVNLAIDYIENNNNQITVLLEDSLINSLNLMKGLLAVLPSSVFVNQDNFNIFKALTKINNTFENLFTLENVSTPTSIMSFKELEIIKALQILEKSKIKITQDIITKTLYDYSIISYDQQQENNSLFVNLIIANIPVNISVTYCFNIK